MTSAPSKLYADDVSLLVVLLDTNPFFWSTFSLPFSEFISHVLAFLNSILLLSQLNQIVVIATGCNSCSYIYDSSSDSNHSSEAVGMPALYSNLLQKLEEFVAKDEQLGKAQTPGAIASSLLSGSLSMALCCILLCLINIWIMRVCVFLQLLTKECGKHPILNIMAFIFIATLPNHCYLREEILGTVKLYFALDLFGLICYSDIQRIFRSGPLHPQPRILCLQGSPDGPEQYVAVMNAIFSAQRSMVPIDSCYIGSNNSAFLQQASYITGGIYYRPPQLDGLFQYLSMVFATDLHSRAFLRLPKSVGVDFRASCFCHKQTIDMGYVCSVCLSIFCEHHQKCSTCGSVFGQSQSAANR